MRRPAPRWRCWRSSRRPRGCGCGAGSAPRPSPKKPSTNCAAPSAPAGKPGTYPFYAPRKGGTSPVSGEEMPRFAANLTMMYNEHAFLDRFAAAARDGFRGVEFLFPYEFAAADIRARLDQSGLTQALFNAPPGDWAKGERGMASIPGREDEL